MLGEQALHAHQQYLASGKLSPALLRDPIFRAWERSHLQGASARRAKAIELDPLATERLLDKEQEVILAAKPYLRALSKAAGNDQHAAMLGNAKAIVLDVLGDDQSVHGPLSVPGPGSLLDESACGANGIGTPLAEGGYAELVGPEHFIEGFHPFSCQGIPIRATDGEIIGALSVSVKRPEAGRRLQEILICAAHGIEMELARRRLEADLHRMATSPIISDAFVEHLRQDVVQALTAARLNVELAARDLGRQRMQYVSYLLGLANRSMDVFRRQGALWSSLITTQMAAEQNVDLGVLVRDLTQLLETEQRTRRVTVYMTGGFEPTTLWADPHEAARAVFRAFLRALDIARSGGSVRISVRTTLDAQGEVCFEAIPGTDTHEEMTIFSVKRPLANALQTSRAEGPMHL
ncbi:MAG TPA: hypothetical protein PK156_12970 [Polyangium sp.]|nr:hypothetical protein [Polyangium sp.]